MASDIPSSMGGNGQRPKPGEKRGERRFRSVGIALLFSPAAKGCVPGFGQLLYQASAHDISLSGMSFDVKEPATVGDELVIHVQQPDDWVELLYTEICWCKILDSGGYRLGVKIKGIDLVHQDEPDAKRPMISIAKEGADIPSSLDMNCPACLNEARFHLVAIQPVANSDGGMMPLYNCAQCGTTRSLTGLFCFNRKA